MAAGWGAPVPASERAATGFEDHWVMPEFFKKNMKYKT